MKTFILFLWICCIGFAANSQTVIVDLIYTGTPPASKFTLYQNTSSTNRVKLIDNIPSNSKAVALTLTNGSIYTLSASATISLGTQQIEVPSNTLQPIMIIFPVIAFR